MMGNEGLEKARAYLNQVPQDWRLYIPSKGCSKYTYFWQSWVDSWVGPVGL